MLLNEYAHVKQSSATDALLSFFETLERNASEISIEEKRAFVSNLLSDLDKFPSELSWPEQVASRAVQTLKVLGRSTEGSEDLFSKQGITTLMKLGGLLDPNDQKDTALSQEALKCISNCLLLKDATKAWFLENNGIDSCGRLLKTPDLSMESQFLACRILLFTTVNRPDLVKELVKLDIGNSLADILTQNVDKLEKSSTGTTNGIHSPNSAAVITPTSVTSEGLKLLFNLLLTESRNEESSNEEQYYETAEHFCDCLSGIFRILFTLPLQTPLPLSPPVTHAVHAMMQFPYAVMLAGWRRTPQLLTLYTTNDEGRKMVADRMCDMLEGSLKYLIPNGDPDESTVHEKHHNIDATLSPLLLVVRSLAAGEPEFVRFFRDRMLPTESDRDKPVHQGSSLPARLIRIMTSAMLPQTREAVSEALFVLCDSDAKKFTQEVGYGNAIGFLVNRGIAVEPPEGTDPKDPNKAINPITGQYLSSEKYEGPSLSEMTDEEKEREAERLFVLFERLKKTGVVDVENPVAKAMREGKLQELSDDDKSSDDDDD